MNLGCIGLSRCFSANLTALGEVPSPLVEVMQLLSDESEKERRHQPVAWGEIHKEGIASDDHRLCASTSELDPGDRRCGMTKRHYFAANSPFPEDRLPPLQYWS